jgi:nicotinate-nucleotide adenylyltransferase
MKLKRYGSPRKGLRIGIYAGAFNPVHTGHIAFALQALRSAGLDEVVFLPERQPRYKPDVEHFAHRTAMIKRALRPYRNLSVLELVDRHFTVSRTLPQLQSLFAGNELVFMAGSDTALGIPRWQYSKRLLTTSGLVIGVRSEHQMEAIEAAIAQWPVKPRELEIIQSYASDVSSADVRQALRTGTHTKGLLSSVGRYARREWLYITVT